MNWRTKVLFPLLLLLLACFAGLAQEHTIIYGDAETMIKDTSGFFVLKPELPDGYYKVLYPGKGKAPAAAANYKKHKRQDAYKEWYRSNVAKVSAYYLDGKLDGLYLSYYHNAQLRDSVYYSKGVMMGEHHHWDSTATWHTIWPTVDGHYQGTAKQMENGHLIQLWEYENGKQHGAFERYNLQQQLLEKGQYQNGLKHGRFIKYFDDNKIKFTATYVNGQLDGETKLWYPSGKLKQQEHFKAGQKHGISLQWFEDGKLASRRYFFNGLQVGDWAEWHSNGKMRELQTVDLKAKTLARVAWDENGIMTFYQDYTCECAGKMDTLHTVNYRLEFDKTGSESDGEVIQRLTLKEVSGVEYILDHPIHPINHGRTFKWHHNAQLALQQTYQQGQLVGTVTRFYMDGTKQMEGSYKMHEGDDQVFSKKDGKWSYWGEDGKLIREEWYENGKIVHAP